MNTPPSKKIQHQQKDKMKGTSRVSTYIPFSTKNLKGEKKKKNLKGEALGGCFLFFQRWKSVGGTSARKSILTPLISGLLIRNKTGQYSQDRSQTLQ